MIKTYGIVHVHLHVEDLERSIRFYNSIYGMQEIARFGSQVILRTPGTRDALTLNQVAGHDIEHFGLLATSEAPDLDGRVEIAVRHGARFVEKNSNGSAAFVLDPDGYKIEL